MTTHRPWMVVHSERTGSVVDDGSSTANIGVPRSTASLTSLMAAKEGFACRSTATTRASAMFRLLRAATQSYPVAASSRSRTLGKASNV
jgi:hypothetical protein